MTAIGLSGARIVFHSLRHGGATELFQSGMPLDNIAHQGRWRSLTTARRYINTGLALLTQGQITERRQQEAEWLRRWW